MTIRAVFFDLDDTLIATSGTRHERAMLAAARLVRDNAHLDANALAERMLTIAPEGRWPIGADGVVSELGLQDTDAGHEAGALWWFEGSEHLLTPVEGVLEVIAALRPELKVGVITNGPERIQRLKYDSLKLHDRVCVFLTSERAGCYKPDVRIFEMALREAEVEPHEAVFVGDAFDNDVVGALEAGMHAVWFNPAGLALEVETASGHHELRSFADFPAILQTLDAE